MRLDADGRRGAETRFPEQAATPDARIETGPGEYEYRGLLAATWDLFRGDTSRWADRQFFRERIRRCGEPALDVGCGTGRLLLDYLRDGLDVDGVDSSPEMLALCRRRAEALNLSPRLYLGEMASLDLPRRYGTLFVPSSSFQLLTRPADAAAAMRRFLRHLRPGGTLVMAIMDLTGSPGRAERCWRLTGDAVRPADGVRCLRWSRDWYDPEQGLEHSETRYELRRGDTLLRSERHRRSPAVRSYTLEAAVDLFRAAGFAEIRVCREFTEEPAAAGDTLFTAAGCRPETDSGRDQ